MCVFDWIPSHRRRVAVSPIERHVRKREKYVPKERRRHRNDDDNDNDDYKEEDKFDRAPIKTDDFSEIVKKETKIKYYVVKRR